MPPAGHHPGLPRVSVALATFNGGRFLPTQLASIGAQHHPPDELVVCDDASHDNTVAVVRAFSETAPFPVRVEVNPATRGTAANFTRAIGLATGDLILTADQDDVWRPDKIARVVRAMAEHPAAGLVFSDAVLVDDALRPTGHTLWRALGVTAAERRQLAAGEGVRVLARRNVVTGATMAFRAAYRDLVLPVPDGWVPDAWIALLVAAVAPVVSVEEPLVEYRQHAGQQIGARPRGLGALYRSARAMTAATFRDVEARFTEALDRLSRWPGVRPEVLRTLEEKVRHAEARARMRDPGAWRLPAVLRECRRGNYRRFSRGWAAAAQDLFLP